MFFKSLRSRSKSSSKSTKPFTLTRILSSASSHPLSKIPEVTISSPPLSPNSVTDTFNTKSQVQSGVVEQVDVNKDYVEFLEKARKDAEKAKKEEEKKAKKAREVNMSPWSSRMNC